MRKLHGLARAAVTGSILLSACAEGQAGASGNAASLTSLPQGSDVVELDPANFTTEIDNPYWPMTPGTRWTYQETDESGDEVVATVTVSSETKETASGIVAVVVRDSVTLNGELIEDTFDWYAQDTEGNIWYLGENTAEFEAGEITTTAGSFEAGDDGAQAGIIMPANPQDGMRYRQEYYAGEAEDNGEILSTDEQAEVPLGHFTDVLLTKDTITIEPDVLEYKLYAPEIGPVLVLGVSGGAAREELIAFETIDAEAARLAGTTPLGQEYP